LLTKKKEWSDKICLDDESRQLKTSRARSPGDITKHVPFFYSFLFENMVSVTAENH